MEEKNITEQTDTEDPTEIPEEMPASAELANTEELPAPTAGPDGESTEEEEPPTLSAENFAKTLANPMFAVFARGRKGSVEDAARDFDKMLAAGRSTLSEEDRMKMTPSAGFSATGGVALSERQRKIARDAGMSYREYYEIISAIPAKTK